MLIEVGKERDKKGGKSDIKFNDIFRAGKRFGIMSEDEVYMRREIGEPRSENLSEAEFAVLETIYELKNKRRMSTILINDVLRRGQTKHKGIREEGYLRLVIPGYELTRKGIEVLNV